MSKNFLLNLLISSCFLMIMPACKQQEREITLIAKQEDTITLQAAQHWYNEQLSHQTAVNSKARTTKYIKREPLWKFAQNIYLANGVFVISVPLQYEKGYGLGKGGVTKLLIFRDKQGHLQAHILKAISDMSYLTDNKGQINQQSFSGILLMEDWQENFLNGVRYRNGKIVGELSPAESSKNGRIAGVCQEVKIEYYVNVCGGGSCSGLRFDYADVYMVCGGGSGNSGGVSSGSAGGAIGGGGGSGSSGNGYSNGGENNRADGEGRASVVREQTDRIIFPGINNPAINLKSFLNCFGTAQSNDFTYTLTIYVEEPVPGSDASTSLTGNVGHTCIGLTKTDKSNPASSITQIIGFYPVDGKKSLSLAPVESEVHNNGDSHPDRRTQYTVSSSYEVSPAAFGAAIQAADELSAKPYDLDDNNCTDYVLNIMNRAGVSVPQNKGDIMVSTGHNPGQLGYDLRQEKQTNPGANISLTAGLTIPGQGSCY
jgi:uncharacterized membrane protein YgcG